MSKGTENGQQRARGQRVGGLSLPLGEGSFSPQGVRQHEALAKNLHVCALALLYLLGATVNLRIRPNWFVSNLPCARQKH